MRGVAATVFGLLALLGALAVVVIAPGSSGGALLLSLVVLVGVVGFVGALVKIAGSGGESDGVVPVPWEESGALVERAPERSPAASALSGERLAERLETAGETARDEGTVAAGIEVVRPSLRDALLGALVQGGTDRETSERALADGSWTGDPAAAAVLDETVDHPGWSLLERFEAWLFPEQMVRREVRGAVQAVAEAADRELPTVPGQHAPRTVPVLRPTLEDLRRGADGHLQRAVDPLGARTGSHVDGGATVDGATTDRPADDESAADVGPADEREADEPPSSGDRPRSPGRSLDDAPIGGRTGERDDGEVSRR